MNTLPRDFCVACGDDRPIRHERQQTEYDVRGEKIILDLPVAVCENCGTIEVEDDLDPPAMAFAEYRSRKGLLTPSQIREIRKQYKLSQKSLADLLGMSEATINRYEGGGLQDEAHDQAIRACDKPDVLRDLLQRRGDRLSAWQRRRAEEALDGEMGRRSGFVLNPDRLWNMPNELSLTTGFRRFDYKRYAAVAAWFCQHLKTVTATSLNKLLFYVDFLHFRSESLSLTGAAYRRLDYGPVPTDFGGLREQMELDRFVEVREVEYQNGNVGEEYRVGSESEGTGVTFLPREVRALEAVAHALGRLTPSKISQRSHEESAWRNTEDRAMISYEEAMHLSLALPD